MNKRTLQSNRKAQIVFSFFALAFYIWLSAQIPYCHDDWDWGLPVGVTQLLTASLNSRYAGNMVEVALTRSPILKTCLMGSVFALIPTAAAVLVSRIYYEQDWREHLLIPALIGNILMLTLPITIWQQTFGWVAGFANFVVSALLLVCWQLMLLSFDGREKAAPVVSVLAFVFGVVLQLFLENLTVYVLLLTTVAVIHSFRKRSWKDPTRALWLGTILGTAIMFSSNIYSTLLATGAAVDGYRTLSFDRGAGLLSVLFGFFRRFVILYPNYLLARNTVLCCFVLLLMIAFSAERDEKQKRIFWCISNLLFFLYFVFIYPHGGIQLKSQWWTNVISAGISWLFFLEVLLQIHGITHEAKLTRNGLLYFWLSIPLVILPMVVVSSVGPRSFLSSDMFFIEFSLLLAVHLIKKMDIRRKTGITVILMAVLCGIWLHIGMIYCEIGDVKNLRQETIRQAQRGEKDHIVMQIFPHSEYLWGPDPANGGERVPYFREFYRIPEGVALWFESWGEEQNGKESDTNRNETNQSIPIADYPAP